MQHRALVVKENGSMQLSASRSNLKLLEGLEAWDDVAFAMRRFVPTWHGLAPDLNLDSSFGAIIVYDFNGAVGTATTDDTAALVLLAASSTCVV
jgi:hypothetical protein